MTLGVVNARDLPLASDYVNAVSSVGATVRVRSRWLNAVSVRATALELDQIAQLSFVRALWPVARAAPRGETPASPGPPPPETAPVPRRVAPHYGLATEQITRTRLDRLHAAGYTGQGVLIAILDSGFRQTHAAFHHADKPLHVYAQYDFINNDWSTGVDVGDPPNQHKHGTRVLGTLAAYAPGELVGGAFDASYILCKTEDTTAEYPAEEDLFVAALEFVELLGADVVTASLSYSDWYTQADMDGQTAVTTRAVNIATAKGMHCCTSVSNAGHDDDPNTAHLGAPADAFEVISCGATFFDGTTPDFTADGPTADGRIKPELVAPGVYIITVSASEDDQYGTVAGTSFATPLVAATVACLTQAHPEWSPQRMRDVLFRSADDYFLNGMTDPLFVRGYGALNAQAPLLDCNQNHQPDRLDIDDGSSPDCTRNGVPDECEPDCNANGRADSCDIAVGLSLDCDHNGVPDACDVASGDAEDCNANDVPDHCEVAPQEVAQLAGGNAQPDARFGFALSIAGDTLVVGAYQDDTLAPRAGIAYVFSASRQGWQPSGQLAPPSASPYDYFGRAVAVVDDLALIGVPGHDANGADSGAACLFRKHNELWLVEATLLAPDGHADARFGRAVAISGGTLVVGAPYADQHGAVYVFRYSQGWQLQQKLTPESAAAGDEFGAAVAIDRNRIAVGAPQADPSGPSSGAVHIFDFIGGAWHTDAILTPADGAPNDTFGSAVAMFQQRVVCGAPGSDDPLPNAGAAYVFERTGDTWLETARLGDQLAATNDRLGHVVATNGNLILCGAPQRDTVRESAGAAFLFQLGDDDLWQPKAELTATNGPAYGLYGSAVALQAERAVGGAYLGGTDGSSSGFVRVHALFPGDCNANGVPDTCDIIGGTSLDTNGNNVPDECERVPGDLDCDGAVDWDDVIPFVWAVVDPTEYELRYPDCDWLNADLSRDGRVDVDDVPGFVDLLSA